MYKDGEDCNAAHIACRASNSEAAILLLDEMYKYNTDSVNERAGEHLASGTCLHIATRNGLAKVVEWLLAKDAEAYVADSDCMTAWDICLDPLLAQPNDAMHAFLDHYFKTLSSDAWLRFKNPWEKDSGLDTSLKWSDLREMASNREASDKAAIAAIQSAVLVRANNRVWILAYLKWAMQCRCGTGNLKMIAFVDETFRETDKVPVSREPAVAFRDVSCDCPLDIKLGAKMKSIVMPYIYRDTWETVRGRQAKVAAQQSDLFRRGNNRLMGVHSPLTIDEYCNSSLTKETLLDRNQDQVLWRHQKGLDKPGQKAVYKSWHYEEGKLVPTAPKSLSQGIRDSADILMVHQVWVYAFRGGLFVALPKCAQGEVRLSVLELLERADKVEEKYSTMATHSRAIPSVVILSDLIQLVETSFLPSCSGSVLDVFQQSIAHVSNDVDYYFTGPLVSDQVSAASNEKEYFHVISDFREELSMVISVISQQEEVLLEMTALFKREFAEIDRADSRRRNSEQATKEQLNQGAAQTFAEDTALLNRETVGNSQNKDQGNNTSKMKGKQGIGADASKDLPQSPAQDTALEELTAILKRELVGTSQTKDREEAVDRLMSKTFEYLQKLKRRLEKLDKDAERVQNLIPQYLDLKPSYMAMNEAHWTAVMGAAVFGFTIVTVIFTPLSFILALLALPGDSLLVGQVQEKKREYVGKWAAVTEVASLVFTAAAVALALFFFKNKSAWKPKVGKWLPQKSRQKPPSTKGPRSGGGKAERDPSINAEGAARARRGRQSVDLEQGQVPKA